MYYIVTGNFTVINSNSGMIMYIYKRTNRSLINDEQKIKEYDIYSSERINIPLINE